MAVFTLGELAELLGLKASDHPGPAIEGVKPLEFAGSSDITYVQESRYLEKLSTSSAGAVILPKGMKTGKLPFIESANPEASFARLTALYYPYPEAVPGISPKAEIHPEALLGKNVSVGPFAVIGKGTILGDGTVIGSHAAIGDFCKIGSNTRVFDHVTIYSGVLIGDRVIIHAGTVVGSDGFGYARDFDEKGLPVYIKKYHTGTVEIADDVEIGALVAIDRALAGVTRIGKGVKLDNLVQIAHNVQIGDSTVIASQAGIAGSSSVGRFGLIGGQAGVKDHVEVGEGVVLAAKVGVYRNVPSGSIMAGSIPAMPHKIFLRVQTLFKRLPEMLDRIKSLEASNQTVRKSDD